MWHDVIWWEDEGEEFGGREGEVEEEEEKKESKKESKKEEEEEKEKEKENESREWVRRGTGNCILRLSLSSVLMTMMTIARKIIYV